MALLEIHFNNCVLRIETLRNNQLGLGLGIFSADFVRFLKIARTLDILISYVYCTEIGGLD